MPQSFKRACAIIGLPCINGDVYINPCNCASFLQCVNGLDVIVRPCSNGTVWDHVTNRCDLTNRVVNRRGRCDLASPWDRCEDVDYHQDISYLEEMCTGGSRPDGGSGDGGSGDGDNSSETDDNNDSFDGGGGGGGVNTAAVVGAVLGCLFIVVVAVIVYFVIKKRSGSKSFSKSQSLKANKKEEPHQGQEEEVYDVIDDKDVNLSSPFDNPGYQEDNGKAHPGGNWYNNLDGPEPRPRQQQHHHHHHALTGGATPHPHHAAGHPNYANLKPDTYKDVTMSYSPFKANQEEDLSRSISVNGKEVVVQDSQGYFIGYPSGAVPRQPSPAPTRAAAAAKERDSLYFLADAPGLTTPATATHLKAQTASSSSNSNGDGQAPDYFVLQTPSEIRRDPR